MKLRKFIVYLDGGSDCFKIAVPAKNKKEAIKFCEGNGDLISVKDVTEEYPIDLSRVYKALLNAGFGYKEIDFITRTLQETQIAE